MFRGLALALIVALVAGQAAACGGSARQRVEVRIGGLAIKAELATTPDERAQGLSGRPSLSRDAGMLFVFPGDERAAFWMKDMRFPLDFVWISADMRVVGVMEDVAPPAPGTPDAELPQFSADAPARYVLEVNAGTVALAGIHAGDAVTFTPEVSLEEVK